MYNKLFFSLTTIVICSLLLMGCNKNDTSVPYTNYGQYYFAGDGSASQIVPTNTLDSSVGISHFSGVYDSSLQIFNYTISWTALSSKVIRLDFFAGADTGQVAPFDRNIATYTSSSYLPTTYTYSSVIWATFRLSGTEFTSLKNGLWYYVIKTQDYSGGELRGQINFVKVIK